MEGQTLGNTAAIVAAAATIAILTGYYSSQAGSTSNSNNISQLNTITKPIGTSQFFSTGLKIKGEHLNNVFSGEVNMSSPNYDGVNYNSGHIDFKTNNISRLNIKK